MDSDPDRVLDDFEDLSLFFDPELYPLFDFESAAASFLLFEAELFALPLPFDADGVLLSFPFEFLDFCESVAVALPFDPDVDLVFGVLLDFFDFESVFGLPSPPPLAAFFLPSADDIPFLFEESPLLLFVLLLLDLFDLFEAERFDDFPAEDFVLAAFPGYFFLFFEED